MQNDEYIAVDSQAAFLPTVPKSKARKTLTLAASFVAIAVGVVLIVALTHDYKLSAKVDSDDGRPVSRSDDRPEGTPFIHTPSCPVLQFCNDGYKTLDASSKQRELMLKAREDLTSGPEAGISDQIGILDPSGLVDPNANPFVYAFQLLLTKVGTSILNAISKGLDVRTTFGIGLDWQKLKNDYLTGDEIEHGRPKAIHAVGVVGSVTLDTSSAEPHPFTGMFKEGFKGIIRFSSAVPITRGTTKKRFVLFGPEEVKTPFVVAPGLGLKATITGKDSADLVAMWHLDGQPGEWNFFAHEFSTVVPGSNQVALKLVGKHFEDASKCPSHISLVSFASFTQDGQEVDVPNTPYSLVFVPNKDLKQRFDDMVNDGYLPSDVHACEDESKCPDVLNSLTEIAAGQLLYTVYAITSPDIQAWHGEAGRYETFDPTKPSEGLYRIGELKLTSVLGENTGLTRSKFGDTGLFFRHRLFEDGVLNAFCLHGQNWMPNMRTSLPVISRNYPTCALGGNDDDGTDTQPRKDIACRLLFRAKAVFPDCFSKVVDLWNSGGFFPFARSFDRIEDEAEWLDWCGSDDRPKSADSRNMVEQSFS